MELPTQHTFRSMTASEIAAYFSINSYSAYTCVNTGNEYSPYDISELTHLLFCNALPKIEQENLNRKVSAVNPAEIEFNFVCHAYGVALSELSERAVNIR
ncbi:MAG: hypothetical protein EOM23_10840, partial [Candidatus Moranbacteria bacterium]|nr:hypothetical protein [Candidatus Moranbacteria bacterium]